MRWLVLLLVFLISILPSLQSVVLGGFPFWFDPARDLLLALDNLKKITLIGPPTGIPGLFYGPYWIWLLSLPLLISRDPRFVVLLVQALPYLVIFPLLLWQFKKTFGTMTLITLWLLFILAFNKYATFLWNPHLAPLLFLFLIFLTTRKRTITTSFLMGLVAGLILNFHFSFGLAAIFATFVTVVLSRALTRGLTFGLGLLTALAPFFVFEIRHGGNQTAAFYHTLTNSMFYNSAVVGQIGLSKLAILGDFQQTLASLLAISPWALLALEIPLIVWLAILIKRKKLKFDQKEKELLTFLTLTLAILAYLFFSSKNPIWEYHFIGVETVFLLLLGIIANKIPLFSRILFFWSLVLLLGSLVNFIKTPIPRYDTVPSLQSKKAIVESIFRDANEKPFAVYTYSSALYTYDFDYLFSWLGQTKRWSATQIDPQKANLVYLIIPESPKAIAEDFVHYRTPDLKYQTLSQWKTADNTTIVKRGRFVPTE